MTSPQRPEGTHIGRYVSLAIGAVGAIIGILVDLYTDQARSLVEAGWARFALRWLPIGVVVMLSCLVTWIVCDQVWKRRRARQTVLARSLDIHTEDFEDDLPHDQTVIGRKLRFLELQTSSSKLVVFLHGLGLDANDFRRYMLLSDAHSVALTLFGFNIEEAYNDRYRPIGLKPHADLVSGAINNIQRQNPHKDLVLVGFSLGADMILRLAELWHEHPERAPKVSGALLLDPNVNHTTMNISSAVAKIDIANPPTELKRLVQQTATMAEFQNICEYLHKITYKNLAQVRRHAQDFVDYWNGAGDKPDLFLQRVVNVTAISPRVRVVFSFHYEHHFNELVAAARAKGMSRYIFEATSLDHFELLSDELLTRELSEMGVPPP